MGLLSVRGEAASSVSAARGAAGFRVPRRSSRRMLERSALAIPSMSFSRTATDTRRWRFGGAISPWQQSPFLAAQAGNRRLIGFPQDRNHLLFGKTTLLHGLLAGEREPFSQVTIGPKNLGRSLLLDEQEDEFRQEIVEASARTMFGEDGRKTLIEPPIQAESHMYQTLQCADWICGLVGRLGCHLARPDEFSDFEWAEKYFGDRIRKISPGSGIRRQQDMTAATQCLFANSAIASSV